MRIPPDVSSFFSNFYLDGEAAFMDGASLDGNPYEADDAAAAAWQAGWLVASHAATMVVSRNHDVGLYDIS